MDGGWQLDAAAARDGGEPGHCLPHRLNGGGTGVGLVLVERRPGGEGEPCTGFGAHAVLPANRRLPLVIYTSAFKNSSVMTDFLCPLMVSSRHEFLLFGEAKVSKVSENFTIGIRNDHIKKYEDDAKSCSKI